MTGALAELFAKALAGELPELVSLVAGALATHPDVEPAEAFRRASLALAADAASDASLEAMLAARKRAREGM